MKTQWSVAWAVLDPVLGSEQAGRRPVIVVSRDSINQALPVVAVVPITSFRRSGKVYATEVLLRAGTAGLRNDSLALSHQVRTISVARLVANIGTIVEEDIRARVRKTLSLFLDL